MDRLLAREKAGKPVPELLNQPLLSKEEGWFMELFNRLGTSRQIGMAVGPLPHSVVEDYALRNGLGFDGVEELWWVLKRLDEHLRAAIKPKEDQGGAGSGRLSHKGNSRPVRRGRRKSDSGDSGPPDWSCG